MVPPLITLEEHFLSASTLSSASSKGTYAQQFLHLPSLAPRLADLGPLRLSSMNAGQVSLQIISHAPGALTPSQCRAANDQLHAAIRDNPTRFAGFATLPMDHPEEIQSEFTRCVKELGFVGALIDNHTSTGVFFDGPAYREALWGTAAKLAVPVYLHPAWPTDAMSDALYRSTDLTAEQPIPVSASESIGTSAYGWHATVAVHFFRLFAAGVFDEFPELQVILGHFGEMIPFQLARVIKLSGRWGERKRGFKEVWDGNVKVTTSGVWGLEPLVCMLSPLGVPGGALGSLGDGGHVVMNTRWENILYSVDYPFARDEDGLVWVKRLESMVGEGKGGGLGVELTREMFEGICYKNAERLLRVKAVHRFEVEKKV